MSNKNTRLDLVHNDKLTKIDRYGWAVLDRPGVFMMIKKSDLLINHESYQREQAASKILRLASEWSWLACGALTVAFRDGAFWVADGGHRKLAADNRSDIIELPCMVFEVASLAEEALAFVRTNVNRKPISAIDKMRGLAVSGDITAQKVEELARQAGRRIANTPEKNTITCVAALHQCLTLDEAALVRLWPLITQITIDHPIHKELVFGMFYCERNLVEGQSLLIEPWRSRVRKIGATGLLDHMHKAKVFHSSFGPRILGLGVLAAINKHARVDLARFRNADGAT